MSCKGLKICSTLHLPLVPSKKIYSTLQQHPPCRGGHDAVAPLMQGYHSMTQHDTCFVWAGMGRSSKVFLYCMHTSRDLTVWAGICSHRRVDSRQRASATMRDSRRLFKDCIEVLGTMSSFMTTEVQNSAVIPARFGPQKPPGGENAQHLISACRIHRSGAV